MMPFRAMAEHLREARTIKLSRQERLGIDYFENVVLFHLDRSEAAEGNWVMY